MCWCFLLSPGAWARPWAAGSKQRGLLRPAAEQQDLGNLSASTEKCSYLERSVGGRLFGFGLNVFYCYF